MAKLYTWLNHYLVFWKKNVRKPSICVSCLRYLGILSIFKYLLYNQNFSLGNFGDDSLTNNVFLSELIGSGEVGVLPLNFSRYFTHLAENLRKQITFGGDSCLISNKIHTPKINMEHNHGGLEGHFSFLNGWFVGSMLIFQGVTTVWNHFNHPPVFLFPWNVPFLLVLVRFGVYVSNHETFLVKNREIHKVFSWQIALDWTFQGASMTSHNTYHYQNLQKLRFLCSASSTPLWDRDSVFCISSNKFSPLWHDMTSLHQKPQKKMSPKLESLLCLARYTVPWWLFEDFWVFLKRSSFLVGKIYKPRRHLPRAKRRQNPLQSSVVRVSAELLGVEGHPKNSQKKYAPPKFNSSPLEKWMVGKGVSFWDCLFLGAMLNFRAVNLQIFGFVVCGLCLCRVWLCLLLWVLVAGAGACAVVGGGEG